jgi:hypothetical protein
MAGGYLNIIAGLLKGLSFTGNGKSTDYGTNPKTMDMEWITVFSLR